MEKLYLILDTSNFLEFHYSDEGLDYTLYNEKGNEIDGGVIENFDLTEEEALKEIEGFLDNIRPKVNLEKTNIEEISQERFEELTLDNNLGVQRKILAEKIVKWLRDYDEYAFRNDYQNSEQAQRQIEGTLEENPLAVYEGIRTIKFEMYSDYELFDETEELLNEVGNYVINAELNTYFEEYTSDGTLLNYVGSSEATDKITEMYTEVLGKLGIDNIAFIETSEYNNSEGGYVTEFTFKSEGTLRIEVEDVLDRAEVIDAILHVKQIADLEKEMQQEISSVRHESILPADERKIFFEKYRNFIKEIDLSQLPKNSTELKENFLRAFYIKVVNEPNFLQLNFKAMNNEIDKFYKNNAIEQNFYKVGDILKVEDKLEHEQNSVIEEAKIEAVVEG